MLIVLVAVVFTGVAVVFSLRQEPVYEAQASLTFRAENEDFSDIGAPAPITQSPEQRAAVRAQEVTDLVVARRAARRLDSELTPEQLLSRVSAQAQARTHFVVVSARGPEPEFAADLANAFATAARDLELERVREQYRDRAAVLRRQNRRLRGRRLSQFTQSANVDRIARLENLAEFATPASVAVRAVAPADPVSPKPVRNSILGLLVGLTFGLVVAFVRDSLDRRFRGVREIREELGMPLVGHVRDDTLGRSVVGSNGRASLSDTELEAFRILRTNVDFLDVDVHAGSVVVTSALPEEGKSTVATALATTYATSPRKVLLVECDLRRPTLAKRLGIAATPGVSDYLAGKATPQQVLQTVSLATPGIAAADGAVAGETAAPLVCITAGTPSPRPAELLGSQRFKTFLEQVSEAYDTVILDTPPLLSVVDTLELVPLVDRVVMCVRASRTTRDQARAARAALAHFPPRPTGIVVTGVRPGDEADYGYYSYAYAYGPQGS